VIALILLLTGQAMASMDGSILTVTAPSLRADLHASGAELQLVLAVYTIAFATVVVTGARLGDVLGRRRTFLLGLAGFTLASLAGGLAPTTPVLIVARAFQGGCAALMTPQVLSIIQLQFEGQMRARAVGAYSLILAVGVAAGQVLGGLIVGAHLLAAAWRPALLLNAPIGAALLLGAFRWLPDRAAGPPRRLDLAGAALLAAALLGLVLPLTLGRDSNWPLWVWPTLAASVVILCAFAWLERRLKIRGGDPLFDLEVMLLAGVAAGVAAVVLVMATYSGFLLSLTLHLQEGLHFTPLRAGLTFALYACGFGTASLTWTRTNSNVQSRLPVLGPITMGGALLAIGIVAERLGWSAALTAPLLFAGGVGHALGFSPLVHRLTEAVRPTEAADLSGLLSTASLIGNVLGVATFAGIYLGGAAHGSGHALAVTTLVLATALLATTACGAHAMHNIRPRLDQAD
jgi:MFS family permease